MQMDFLSPHSTPSLYTKTMLSLWAMASLVESGLNAMPRTTKFFGPSGLDGLVENLSRLSPLSSKSWTTRSVVTAAMRFELGLLGRTRVRRGGWMRARVSAGGGPRRKVNVPSRVPLPQRERTRGRDAAGGRGDGAREYHATAAPPTSLAREEEDHRRICDAHASE